MRMLLILLKLCYAASTLWQALICALVLHMPIQQKTVSGEDVIT